MPITGISKLAKDLSVEKVITPALIKVHKAISFQLLNGFILLTPVDTGRARAGWQVLINSTTEDVNIDESQFEKGKKNLQGGGQSLEKGLVELSLLKAFDTVHIINNVKYIGFLDDGSSKQAPNGIVNRTIQSVIT